MRMGCRNLRFGSFLTRGLAFVCAGIMITAGFLGFIVLPNLWRIAMNMYFITFGMLLLLADFRAFPFFGYMKFLYSPIGRGLFYLLFGLIMITAHIWDMVLGICLVVFGLLYATVTHCNGGVPKPLTQRNIDQLPLNTELRFVDVDTGTSGTET